MYQGKEALVCWDWVKREEGLLEMPTKSALTVRWKAGCHSTVEDFNTWGPNWHGTRVLSLENSFRGSMKNIIFPTSWFASVSKEASIKTNIKSAHLHTPTEAHSLHPTTRSRRSLPVFKRSKGHFPRVDWDDTHRQAAAAGASFFCALETFHPGSRPSAPPVARHCWCKQALWIWRDNAACDNTQGITHIEASHRRAVPKQYFYIFPLAAR